MDEPKKPSKKLSDERPAKDSKEIRKSVDKDTKSVKKESSAKDSKVIKKDSASVENDPAHSKKDSKHVKRPKVPTIPEPVVAAPKLHACPRCQVTLQPEKYEGVAIEFCDTCWGYWVGRLEFETILTSKGEHFSRDERKVASRAPAHEGDRKMLTCVKCGKLMSKIAVEDDGMVAFLVDYCRDHGLWLDTGEIKRAQILDEKTGAVRKALRASFDRAAVEADEESTRG
ncbi:MAG TPA: zf-TFIIB domain-containing protein [Planctomycetota bacterium]|nr:zf-TFIIB domain-containing protein [Planctomycetota bacterium]